MTEGQKAKGVAAVLLAPFAVVYVALFGLWAVHAATHDGRLPDLLGGDADLRITSFAASGQGVAGGVTDPDSLAYLSAAFRAAKHEGHVPSRRGLMFGGTVWLGSFRPARASLYVADNHDGADGLTVGCTGGPLDDERDYWWVACPGPQPAPVAALLDRLREADRKR